MIEINKDTVVLSLETYMELLDTIEFLKVEVQQGNTVYRYNKGFNDGFDVGVNDGLIEAIELLKTFAKEEK